MLALFELTKHGSQIRVRSSNVPPTVCAGGWGGIWKRFKARVALPLIK